ncbi:MAG TPA: FG-GAP-like repeat-containing protein [Opitutaceae bacterium]|nr:FG-GAP-like repeat-containing protein [Opitutaceae bacterium]
MILPIKQTGWAMFLAWAAALAAAEPLRWQSHPGYRLAAVSPATPGKVGFTLLNAEQTAVRFTNSLSPTSASKNHNLMQGAGVAAGDFDGDGWCDLYFCNVEGRNTLYRNAGGFRFEDVTERAGVACPGLFSTGAAFADVNGDGALDLIVSANNGVALFLNERNGHFTNATVAAGLNAKPLGSTSIALADLDGNGTLDLFIANYGENTVLRSGGEVSYRTQNGRTVVSGRNARRLKIIDGKLIEFGEPSAVYLNDGAAHFTALSWTDGRFRDEDGKPLKELPNDLSLSVMLRDIDGDGAPDIYVCNDFQTPDRIWINDGQAQFRALPLLAMRQQSHFSMGVDFADLDRDGRDDFIVVDMLSRLHTLKMTQMLDTNLMTAGPGEINTRPQIRRNTLFWNRGDGTYAEIANFAGVEATDWTWTPVFLDVDLDGYEDLLFSNGHAFDTQDLDMSDKPQMKGPAAAVANLLAHPKLETPNYAFRNRRDRTFEEVGAAWSFDSRQVCHGVICTDLDNDGDLDVVVSSLNAPPLLYRNDSAAPRLAVRLKGKGANVHGVGAKIEVLGGAVPMQSQQIICGGRYLSADDTVRTFAAGAATNRLRVRVTWRDGTQSELRDVPANSICEIDQAGARPASSPKPAVPVPEPLFKDVSALLGHRHHEPAFDDFARQPLLSRKLSQLGPGVAWMDFDGDGRDEIVIGSGRGGALTVFKTGGQGNFAQSELAGVATDDLLGLSAWCVDGKRSLLVARANYETPASSAVLNVSQTASGFVAAPTALEGGSVAALAVADMRGAGTLQVFVGGRVIAGRYPEAGASRIMNGNAGALSVDRETTSVLQNVGLVSGAVWSDLNGDGFPELILACEWGSIRIFKNQQGKLSAWNPALSAPALHAPAATLENLTGWWTSVTTGDFDGDGRLDIVAGNWGLNSWYRATPAVPQRLYYGDFNGDGSAPLIEAEFDPVVGKIVPRENLTLLAPALPFLRARFPTYASSRAASVSEALGDRFPTAKELRAATLATMLFLNRGDRFEAIPLPAEAQWAPVFGLSVADVDGDGADDLFLAQNFFAMRKEIPRFDAGRGLWLRNDGQGNLRPLSGAESGVIAYGSQRGCALGDYDEDGRIDLVLTQNGAETKLFRNERARPGLRVRLKGPPGNPDGLGAVVRLKYKEGSGPAREVHGGAGYLSQDSAITVLGQRREPTHVAVRWPGGATSEVPVTAGAKEIVVGFK